MKHRMDWPWRMALLVVVAAVALPAWPAQGKEAIMASGRNSKQGSYLRWDGVLSLDAANLDSTVKMYDFIVVAFYSPVCPYCQQFGPEYMKAAAVLMQETPPITLAALDATISTNEHVVRQHAVTQLPTMKIFRNKGLVEFELDYRDALNAEMIIEFLRNEAAVHKY